MSSNAKQMTAYCVKCKAKKNIAEAKEVTMKNGRKAMKGKCPDCGTGMYRILGNKQQPPFFFRERQIMKHKKTVTTQVDRLKVEDLQG